MAATLGDPIPISQSSSTVQPRTAPQSARAPLPYRRCTDEYGGIEYGGLPVTPAFSSDESGCPTLSATVVPARGSQICSTAQTALNAPGAHVNALRDTMTKLLAMDQPRMQIAAMMCGLDIHYDLGAGHPLVGRRVPDLDPADNSRITAPIRPASPGPAGAAQPRHTRPVHQHRRIRPAIGGRRPLHRPVAPTGNRASSRPPRCPDPTRRPRRLGRYHRQRNRTRPGPDQMDRDTTRKQITTR
jgi:hypothetical protein